MNNVPFDIEVSVTYLQTSDGGRRTPVYDGYRGQFHYKDDNVAWDAIQNFPENEQVIPGETARAYISFLSPESHVGKITEGTSFLVKEGDRVVATGTVSKVLELRDHTENSGDNET